MLARTLADASTKEKMERDIFLAHQSITFNGSEQALGFPAILASKIPRRGMHRSNSTDLAPGGRCCKRKRNSRPMKIRGK
jgi:hypothetical protein